jgi:hypothetical protein
MFKKEAVIFILLLCCLWYPFLDEVTHKKAQVFAVLLSSVS